MKGACTNRRRSSRPAKLHAKINDRVEIWWSVDKTYYRGTLTRRHDHDQFRIIYDDGEMEDLDLNKEDWRFAIDSSPQQGTILKNEPSGCVNEAILGGSHKQSEKPEAPEEKSLKVDNPKANTASRSVSMNIDKSSSKSQGTKEINPTSSALRTATDAVKVLKSAPSDGAITSTAGEMAGSEKEVHKGHPVKFGDRPIVSSSDDPKAVVSVKSRSKQNVARIPKDGTSEKPKPTLRKAGGAGANTLSWASGGVATSKVHVKPTSGKGKVSSMPREAQTNRPKEGDDVALIGTSKEMEKRNANSKRVAEVAPKMNATHDVGDNISKTTLRKGSNIPDKCVKKRPHGTNTRIQPREGPGVKDACAKGTPERTLSPAKPQGMKSKASETKSESTSQSGQRRTTKSKSPVLGDGASATKVQQVKSEPKKAKDFPDETRETQGAQRRESNGDSVRSKRLLSGEMVPPTRPPAKDFKNDLAEDPARATHGGSNKEKTAKREDSNWSRSSSEKPNTSFAAERKKKKKKTLTIGRGNSMDQNPAPHESSIEKTLTQTETRQGNSDLMVKGKSSRVVEGVKSPAALRMKMKFRGPEVDQIVKPSGKTVSGLSNANSANKSDDVPDGVESNNAEASGAKSAPANRGRTTTQDGRSKVASHEQELRPVVAKERVSTTGPASGKRDRSEEASEVKSAKRIKSQSTQGGNVVESKDLDTVAGERPRKDKQQIPHVKQERENLSPIRNQMEIISKDVHRLVSMVLSSKQELEFYKDVIHRSVLEETERVRGVVQGLRAEFLAEMRRSRADILHANEERAIEAEHRICYRIQSMLDNCLGGGGMDRPVRLGHGNGDTHHPVQEATLGFEGSRRHEMRNQFVEMRIPEEPVSRDIAARGGRRGINLEANEHNDSPTGIANVSQGARLVGYVRNEENREANKEAEDAVAMGTLGARISNLVARQVTVWLLETPHEYNSSVGPVAVWAKQAAVRTFQRVAEHLMRYESYMQAYHTLCTSLGMDAVELQWFVSPGVQEHLRRARRNYAAWDPPPSDTEWGAEIALLRELSERFNRALQSYEASDATDLEACVMVSQIAASDEALNGYRAANGNSGHAAQRRSNP